MIESVLTLSITVWGGSITVEEQIRLRRVVNTARRIIGLPLPAIDSLYNTRLLKKAEAIVRDASHPANHLFKIMKSGVRYRSLPGNSERILRSTYPSAIRQLNISLQHIT